MDYISTRGNAPVLDFEGATLAGLASDGGLYVPREWPRFSQDEIAAMAGLPYAELAARVMFPFVEGSLTYERLLELTNQAYGRFAHKAVTPLKQLDEQQWVLELFHGPTLAFKDFALQLLGRLLDSVLARRHQKVVIMGATSGDTGSAAIEGCRHCRNIDIFILHPHGKVSEVQRRQMTTVAGFLLMVLCIFFVTLDAKFYCIFFFLLLLLLFVIVVIILLMFLLLLLLQLLFSLFFSL